MQSSHEAELTKAEVLPPCGDGLCASGGSHVRALNMEGAQIPRILLVQMAVPDGVSDEAAAQFWANPLTGTHSVFYASRAPCQCLCLPHNCVCQRDCKAACKTVCCFCPADRYCRSDKFFV